MAHRGYTKTRQMRQERRVRAEEVALETGYASLSTQQKLDRVLAFIAVPGNGASAKQRARLELQLRREQEPKIVKEKAVNVDASKKRRHN